MKKRLLLVLNFIDEGPILSESFVLGKIRFEVQEHFIGWDFATAEELIRRYDGHADAFCLSGIRQKVCVGKTEFLHPGFKRLERSSRKTPIYVGDEIRDFFFSWTLRQMLKEQPQLFSGKKALFHCSAVTPSLKMFEEMGAQIIGADPLLLGGLPKRLNGIGEIEKFVGMMRHLMPLIESRRFNSRFNRERRICSARLRKWIKESDIFVTFSSIVRAVGDLDVLEGKIIVTDVVTDSFRERLEAAGVHQIIEMMPQSPLMANLKSKHFSLYSAVIDQMRIEEDSDLSFEDYALKMVQKLNIGPNRLKTSKGIQRRCAFIIHPLSQDDIWRAPSTKILANAPKSVRGFFEKAAAKLPIFHYGQLTGAVSQATGQEVICDVYATLATPKQLLSMDEDFVYKRLVEASEQAQKRGALLMGLGAYTKVVGDSGVTVAKRAPIPITTGNSYSASTTLWAAREMMEKMAIVPSDKIGNRFRAKAMIIGATGSIGRVSALLVSLICKEIVLVATTPDKLLELRDEILALSPEVEVRVTTQPDHELFNTDLIVTATSNQSGSILDIHKVKPGAVICDCSRPLDISKEEAAERPDVMVIQSGEVLLPGDVRLTCDIGLPKPSVYACMAETILLTMEGRYESFSLSKRLSLDRVKEIYRLGIKHGAKLSEIQGHFGVITDEEVRKCRGLALERLKSWNPQVPGLTRSAERKARKLKTVVTTSEN